MNQFQYNQIVLFRFEFIQKSFKKMQKLTHFVQIKCLFSQSKLVLLVTNQDDFCIFKQVVDQLQNEYFDLEQCIWSFLLFQIQVDGDDGYSFFLSFCMYQSYMLSQLVRQIQANWNQILILQFVLSQIRSLEIKKNSNQNLSNNQLRSTLFIYEEFEEV
ncbi:hypothetical protein ABPG72_000036 [Tetrahymena utriculariae]